MKIERVSVRRVSMPRVDPGWRTATYAASAVEGLIVEIEADGVVGIGGAAAHPNSVTGDVLGAQLEGPVSSILVGADALERTSLVERLRAGPRGVHQGGADRLAR